MGVEALAREHFYCPGPFNDRAFAQSFRKFHTVRKLCSKYLKSGQMNIPLTLNICILLLNSFGKSTVNEVFYRMYPPQVFEVAACYLIGLGAFQGERFNPTQIDLLNSIANCRKSNNFSFKE